MGLIPACAGRPSSTSRGPGATRAHPRVCGATTAPARSSITGGGSSPRVRGDLRRRLSARQSPGLIPACAGRPASRLGRLTSTGAHPRVCGATVRVETDHYAWTGSSPRVRGDRTGSRSTPVAKRAHPRVCGATFAPSFQEIQNWGSSPRVRGDPQIVAGSRCRAGLIPACAGRPAYRCFRRSRRGAHPRVCGATTFDDLVHVTSRGSSPRVRGDQQYDAAIWLETRLIPACAGRPVARSPDARAAGAHPRVCGATSAKRPALLPVSGSSPRVRGDLVRVQPEPLAQGLIPACAGRPTYTHYPMDPSGAHPRVCGATKTNPPSPGGAVGSSPRVRGDPTARQPSGARSALIPACAGRPHCWTARRDPVRAHPRVCGATSPWRPVRTWPQGSSPRVRGDLDGAALDHGRWGLIPACAGRPHARTAVPRIRRAHPRVCGATEGLPVRSMPDWGSSPRVRGDLRGRASSG